MLKLIKILPLLYLSFFVERTLGQDIENSQRVSIAFNTDCEETDSCDFTYLAMRTIDSFNELSGATRVSTGFKTRSNSALKDFAIVQFHRGCMYTTKNGEIEFLRRSYLGISNTAFFHPEWVVDSGPDNDPIYQSSLRGGMDDGFGFIYPRKENYFTVDPYLENPQRKMDFYMNNTDNEEITKLYVSDAPTAASVENKITVSLEFKTCIFKTDDIPTRISDDSGSLLEKALICLNWEHKWAPVNNKMTKMQELDPVCLRGVK